MALGRLSIWTLACVIALGLFSAWLLIRDKEFTSVADTSETGSVKTGTHSVRNLQGGAQHGSEMLAQTLSPGATSAAQAVFKWESSGAGEIEEVVNIGEILDADAPVGSEIGPGEVINIGTDLDESDPSQSQSESDQAPVFIGPERNVDDYSRGEAGDYVNIGPVMDVEEEMQGWDDDGSEPVNIGPPMIVETALMN